MELEQLTPRVYQLPFSQENDRPALGYIRGDRFSLMVDAGNSPEHVRDYQKAVENAGFPQPDFTVLTHSHWDHCFGLSALSIPSIACVQTRQSLEMVSRMPWRKTSGKASCRSCACHVSRRISPNRNRSGWCCPR